MEKIGTIYLDGEVKITDPGYDDDCAYAECLLVKKGYYDCFATRKRCGEWGMRVKELIIRHSEYPNTKINEYECGISVDSGQAGFYDYQYFLSKQGKINDDWYWENCGITDDWFGTIDGKGVVSRSGYGDGFYDVFASYNEKDEIVGLKIRFI